VERTFIPVNPTNMTPDPEGKLSECLFRLESRIRCVAWSQKGQIQELRQNPRHPSNNPPESDRIKELIVNPIVLEIAAGRGNMDMDGIRYVVIRYGTQYPLLLPYRDGHLSIGIDPQDDPIEIAQRVAAALDLKA
jgi:hypothetical protein